MNLLKKCLFVSALLAGICQSRAYEKLDWSSKSLQAGKASLVTNSYRVSRPLGTANFSPEFAMTVQLIYDSAQNKRGIFGDVWNSPQLESRVFPREFGAEWLSPWGERVPFYQKQNIDKDAPEVYKEKMKGAGFFAPYSEWEAKGSKGSWTITGLHKKEGWTFEYSDSFLRKVSAPSGRSISFSYKNKKLEKVSQDGIAFIELAYDKGEKTVSEIKINGVQCAFTYGSVNAVTLPEKTGQQKTVEARLMLTSIQPEGLAAQKFAYDDCGYMNKFEAADFKDDMTIEHETLDERLAFLKKIDEAKKAKKSTVNMIPEKVSGRILQDKFYTYAYPEKDSVSITNAAGEAAVYNYSDLKGVLKVRDFAGLEQQIFYFRRFDVAYNGKFRQILDAKDRAVMNCRYDKKTGELIRVRDMADNEIYYEYDKSRNLTLVSRTEENPDSPIRPLMAFKYDKSGNMTASEKLDRAGKCVLETKFSYDKSDDIVKVETPEGLVKVDYSTFGYPVKITDSFGRSTVGHYDAFNRLVSIVSPEGVCTVCEYDKAARIASISRYATTEKKELLSKMDLVYDSIGEVVTVMDEQGRVKKFEHDAFGRIASEVFPDNSIVKYSYNELGKLEQVIDQNNHPIAFSWNKFGKLDSKITAAGQIAKYSYDKYGMLEGENNSMGNENNLSREISYKYDEFDRVSSVNYGDGKIKNFKYDSWGKVLEISAIDKEKKEVSKESFKYDEFDRVAGKTIVKSVKDVEKEKLVYEYSYTPSGKRSSVAITFPDGSKKVTKNVYDKYGRLAETVDGSRRVTYKYDDKTARLKEQNINGIPVFYTYTKLGQLESKIMGDVKSPISTLKYFYTKDGQITAREVNGKRQGYEYDVKGQLLAVKDSSGNAVEKYAYDPAGNILSKTVDGKTVTYTYDESNQLISAKTADGKETSYRYDAAGRLTEESGVSTTKEYTYGWLDKVMKVSNTGKSNSEVDFSYHIDGQLASRRSGDKVENFYWDDLALVKKDGTDYINEPYATGGNPVLANDEVMFNDMLGTTLGSVDNGKFSSTPTTAFGAGNENAFFTGKPHVEGLGYAFMFRNYRPEMGKWQTADPLGYPDGWNNFAYCNNAVTSYIDWQGGSGFAVENTQSIPVAQGAATFKIKATGYCNGNYNSPAISNINVQPQGLSTVNLGITFTLGGTTFGLGASITFSVTSFSVVNTTITQNKNSKTITTEIYVNYLVVGSETLGIGVVTRQETGATVITLSATIPE